MTKSNPPLLIGITGASGSLYAKRLVDKLLEQGERPELILSKAAEKVIRFEGVAELLELDLKRHAVDDFFAAPASGNALYHGMVIVPCSMGTLAKVSQGLSDSLLTRAADVNLKEKRKVILVPREMPFNAIHLENMLRLDRAGATVLAANPHFYHHPKTILDLVDTVVNRILDQLYPGRFPQKRWAQNPEKRS